MEKDKNPPNKRKGSAKSRRQLLSLKQYVRPALYGLLCALLTVSVVLSASVLYYNGFNTQNNTNYGSTPYYPQEVWMITFVATMILIGLFAAVGLPYILGRARGFRQVCAVFLFEMFFMVIALFVSGLYISTLYSAYENNSNECVSGTTICGSGTPSLVPN